MVVWKAGNEFEIFEKIAEDALNDACTVLILSQPSADSICAGLIIQARLQAVSRPQCPRSAPCWGAPVPGGVASGDPAGCVLRGCVCVRESLGGRVSLSLCTGAAKVHKKVRAL